MNLVHSEIAKYPSILQCCKRSILDDAKAYVKGTADEAMHVQTRRARAARMRK